MQVYMLDRFASLSLNSRNFSLWSLLVAYTIKNFAYIYLLSFLCNAYNLALKIFVWSKLTWKRWFSSSVAWENGWNAWETFEMRSWQYRISISQITPEWSLIFPVLWKNSYTFLFNIRTHEKTDNFLFHRMWRKWSSWKLWAK